MTTHPDAHITIRQLADYLALDYDTVRKFIDARTLPAHRFGTDIRIRTADAIQFLEASRIRPK